MGPVELVLGLVEALPFLGFDILGILPGESYSDIRALADFIRDVAKYQQYMVGASSSIAVGMVPRLG